MANIVAENALIDAYNLMDEVEAQFTLADIVQWKTHGIDLMLAAEEIVRKHDTRNGPTFLTEMKHKLRDFGRITQPQALVVLNITLCNRRPTLKKVARTASEADVLRQRGTGDTRQEATIECFVCHERFHTWDGLNAHKSQQHSGRKPEPIIAEEGDAKAVIANTVATKGLDLSNLPDGRYAVPDRSGKNDHIFLMVKRVRRTHNRDRRYVYGKVITGNEVVVAGTIEVKLWSSDSKELVGEQKPNDVYRGDLEEDLELVMLMPEAFALLFGKLVGHCCICGKTLTDDVSRGIGMGLECEKKEAYFKKPPTYTFIGKDRPDKQRIDPNDELYLNGTLRYYRPLPKTVATSTSDWSSTTEDDEEPY